MAGTPMAQMAAAAMLRPWSEAREESTRTNMSSFKLATMHRILAVAVAPAVVVVVVVMLHGGVGMLVVLGGVVIMVAVVAAMRRHQHSSRCSREASATLQRYLLV